jgi:hypothetical protein
MENTSANKSLSDSILEMTKSVTPNATAPTSAPTSASPTSVAEESSSGFLGFSLLTWLMIIIVLAFLGFNIFSYMAKGSDYLASGTEQVTGFFAPFIEKIFGTSVATASETIDVAAEGSKAVVTGTAESVNTGLTAVQDVTPNNASSSVHSTSVEEHNKEIEEANNSLNNALNTSSKNNNSNHDVEGDYEPHEASSSVHTGKAGWCFIGRDRGHRTCSQVSETDKCMSGDIFPSQEICINPRLRP